VHLRTSHCIAETDLSTTFPSEIQHTVHYSTSLHNLRDFYDSDEK